MRLSLLQPRIIRGNIEHNLEVIQRLVNESKGELLVLAEYVLTGSLVLDLEADVRDWALRSAKAKARINVPEGKHLLINTLAEFDGNLHNCCELLPTGECYTSYFQIRLRWMRAFYRAPSRRFLSCPVNVSRREGILEVEIE